MKRGYTLGGYSEWTPDRGGLDGVETFWTFATERRVVHRVLPHAGVTLAIETVGPPRGVEAAGIVVMGPAARHRFFVAEPGTEVTAVRLLPEWAGALLGIDPSELVDRIERVGGAPRWSRMRDQLVSVAKPDARLRLLAAVVSDRRSREPTRRARLAHRVLREVRASPQRMPCLPAIARQEMVSERTLRRAVRGAAGLSAKRIQRIERLNVAVQAADAADAPSWGPLAYAHGFSDQAHFVREVRDLAGCTPTDLHVQRRAQSRSPGDQLPSRTPR